MAFKLKKHTKVCSLHFNLDDFEPYELRRRMLRKGVLPSRFLKDEDGMHPLRPMRRRRNANKVPKVASTVVNPTAAISQNVHLPNMSPLISGCLMMSPNRLPYAFPFTYGMSPFVHPPMTPAQMNSLFIQNQMENQALKVRMDSNPPVSTQTVPSIVVPVQSLHNSQIKEQSLPQAPNHHVPEVAIDLTQLKQTESRPLDSNNIQVLQQPLQHGAIQGVGTPMVLDSRQVKSKTSILWPMARLYRRGEPHAENVEASRNEALMRQQADAALRQLTAQHQLMFASMVKQPTKFSQPITSIQSTSAQELIVNMPTQIQFESVDSTPDCLPISVQQSLISEDQKTRPSFQTTNVVDHNISESECRLNSQNSVSRQDSKRSLSNIISRLKEKVNEDPSDCSISEPLRKSVSSSSTDAGDKNGCTKVYSRLGSSVKDAVQMVTIIKIVEQQDELATTTKLMIELPPKELHSRKKTTNSKESRQIVLEVVQKKGMINNSQLSTNDGKEIDKLKEESMSSRTPLDLSVREEKWVHTNGYAHNANIIHGKELNRNSNEITENNDSPDISSNSLSYSKQVYQLPLINKDAQKQDVIGYDILQMLSSHDNPTQLLENQDFTLRLFKFVGTCNASSCINSASNEELACTEEALDLSVNGKHPPDDYKYIESENQQLETSLNSITSEPDKKCTAAKEIDSKNWNKYRVVFDKRLKVLQAKEAAVFYETIYKFQMPEGVMDEAYLLNNFSIQKVDLQGTSGESVYFCNKCVKTLKNLKEGLEHAKKHCERKRFKCKSCSKTYSSIGMIESHVERYVQPDEKKLACDACIKKFAFRGSLMMHVKLAHRDMEKVRCNLCHKEIKRHYMNTHMKRHRNERPHKCNICGKGFVAKKVLTTHLSIHTGYKPYKCQYCGRGFTVKSNMQLHERTHTGDRPFICTVCGKDFINRGTLKGHMLTRHHINLGKVHKCRHCTDSFTRLKTLVEHMEKTHKHLYRKDVSSLESLPQEKQLSQDSEK
ncbi:uncharacterized protein LOC117120102 [Anneissia japonica]|uniref:uncharacterized protein LOC117120102 n=1 Tax=Anneissia japonica TaxID=1529436 RepID=UPI0014259AB0|nr:uncharacterized protein LOC117120102 [Anneissia japonica]